MSASDDIKPPKFNIINVSAAEMHEKFGYPISAALCGEGEWRFGTVIGKSKPSIALRTILDLSRLTEVYFLQEGENDEEQWIFLAKHKSGNYVYFSASCDYTGFDCQGGGEIIIDTNIKDLWQLGITTSHREIIVESLGLKVCKCRH